MGGQEIFMLTLMQICRIASLLRIDLHNAPRWQLLSDLNNWAVRLDNHTLRENILVFVRHQEVTVINKLKSPTPEDMIHLCDMAARHGGIPTLAMT